MIYRLNPFRINILSQDTHKVSEMYIGDVSNVQSFQYIKETNELYFMYEKQWYQVHNPDIDEFLLLFSQFKKNDLKQRIRNSVNKMLFSGKKKHLKFHPRNQSFNK